MSIKTNEVSIKSQRLIELFVLWIYLPLEIHKETWQYLKTWNGISYLPTNIYFIYEHFIRSVSYMKASFLSLCYTKCNKPEFIISYSTTISTILVNPFTSFDLEQVVDFKSKDVWMVIYAEEEQWT